MSFSGISRHFTGGGQRIIPRRFSDRARGDASAAVEASSGSSLANGRGGRG